MLKIVKKTAKQSTSVLSLHHYEQKVFMDHSCIHVLCNDRTDHCSDILDR